MARCEVGYFSVYRDFLPTNENSPFYRKHKSFFVYLTLLNWRQFSEESKLMPFGTVLKQNQVSASYDEICLNLKSCWGFKATPSGLRKNIDYLVKIGFIKKISSYIKGKNLAYVYEVYDESEVYQFYKKPEKTTENRTLARTLASASKGQTDGIDIVEESDASDTREDTRLGDKSALLKEVKENKSFKGGEGRGEENEPIPEPVYDEHPEIIQISDPPRKPLPSKKEIILDEDEEWFLNAWELAYIEKYGGPYEFPKQGYWQIRKLFTMSRFDGFSAQVNAADMARLYLMTDSDFYIDRKHDFEWLITDFGKLQKMVLKYRRDWKMVKR